jgi:hypothetical protein
MAETSEQIRRELERTRARVGGTIAALERKVNPRHVLEDHPIAIVGAAFGVGVLMGATGAAEKAATGTARTVRAQLDAGAHHVSQHVTRSTTTALDGIVQSILSAAATALTAKLTGAFGGSQSASARPAPPEPATRPMLGDGTQRPYVGTDTATGSTAGARSDFRAA